MKKVDSVAVGFSELKLGCIRGREAASAFWLTDVFAFKEMLL